MATSLLTARQVQKLLDVDASTIYRMAGDGRLPAIRIGRQWRFPAAAIEDLLVPRRPFDTGTSTSGSSPRAVAHLLPESLVVGAIETVAPALGVAMVVTDLDGRPLTPLVNPPPALAVRQDDPAFLEACVSEWAALAGEPHLAPRFKLGRLGFLCAHSLVRHGSALIAMVLAGGIADEDDDDPDLHHLDADGRAAVLETLPQTAALLSRLAVLTVPLPDGST